MDSNITPRVHVHVSSVSHKRLHPFPSLFLPQESIEEDRYVVGRAIAELIFTEQWLFGKREKF